MSWFSRKQTPPAPSLWHPTSVSDPKPPPPFKPKYPPPDPEAAKKAMADAMEKHSNGRGRR